jgi:hypothetical protein
LNFAIFEKLQKFWLARAIHDAVRLGLPDLLANSPRQLSELALATNSNEPALRIRVAARYRHTDTDQYYRGLVGSRSRVTRLAVR